jgi:hypothetical protein
MIDNRIEMLEKLINFIENELYLNHNTTYVRLSSLINKNYMEDYEYFVDKLKNTKNIPIKDLKQYDNDIIAELKCKIRELKIEKIIEQI